MKVRFSTIVFILCLLVAFGLGAFLLIVADGMPTPGLILLGISAFALARHLARRGRDVPSGDPGEDVRFRATQRERESYEQELERRRRGESDA